MSHLHFLQNLFPVLRILGAVLFVREVCSVPNEWQDNTFR